ncbi:hypothetical protein FOA52_001007 [Chlamydomonas sp. UWO 241]|nr:hypothetical protein FOA52_001007 [Chlamydomonas sp. UWO 241]
MAALVEDAPLRDAYRLRHPARRGYTFSAHNAQARLDRLYMSPALAPRIYGCDADGVGMADIMADAVAAVSRPAPPSPADREAMLRAVRAHSPCVPQAVADAAGAPAITLAEVRWAVTHSKPGTAPGPDGIPADVWRKLGAPAYALLAAVFTAVGTTGETPPGFLDGVVASIYKAKDVTDAANYRPLTMLGSDYRVLAKVLARWWTPVLAAVVGPEQTAFLAGRRIADNICLTQMLPGLLAANAAEGAGPTGAALALLDFRKAYDTIDRGFLLAVMEAVGVGDGVLAWTRTILTHTYASADVNGFISAPHRYAAADVAALVQAMAVFGRATGLVLNLGKCGILPLGSAGAGLVAGAQVAGLRVLDAGVSLGVPVSAGLPPPEGVTGVCRERLAAEYTKVARFPMSSFGMTHAAATYGVSRISFRAVHCGMTPEAVRLLCRCTAVLVDQRIGPIPPASLPGWASLVPGVPARLLLGRPAHGGFGTLPSGLIGECENLAVGVSLLAGPLRRMLDGVQALGPVARIPGRVRTAELWGAEAPLCANPLLQLELPDTQRTVEWREPPVADLCALWAWLAAVDMVSNTRTVDHACLVVYAAAAPARASLVLGQIRAALACGAYDGGGAWRGVLCRVLFPDAPPSVTRAAGGGAAGEPRWVGFAHGPGVVGKLTCKLAVALQLQAVVDERRVRRAAAVEAALALDHGPHEGPRATDAQVCAGLRGLEVAVPALWQVPLLNARKEPIWRLWAVADAAGAPVVTPAEVRAAATHSKPGTAPGPDGIPVDVWRKLGEPAFVLLAAVFTAVGAAGETPPGFLDGVVASIYKAKDAADAANYRPLTMLGSDYRILAKVLATRWTPLLAAVVGPEQTAFLAGRRISDNICLTQMLPGLLAANAAEGVGPTGAALALLDFRKAYDTIDRGCLLAVMEAVGVGDGVLAWTRTILTHTYASAEVNGFISEPRRYAAGVRQGCPAAPALFLFLGHALACFLRTCPAVGVEVVPGCRVTCPQYADDCMPLLRSCAPAAVAALVEAMAVFGRATGLVLNLGKCGILPLGSAGEGLLAGAEVAGLRVLDAGVSLGVPVSAGLPPPEAVTGVCAGLRTLEAAVPGLWRLPLLSACKEPIWRLWVWLLQPPAGVRAGVWAVVAALVVDAMERGCRHLWRITRPRDGVLPPDRTVSVERAGALATMDLWNALASFAEGGVMPRGWAGVVGPTHPYVGVVDGKLILNKAS